MKTPSLPSRRASLRTLVLVLALVAGLGQPFPPFAHAGPAFTSYQGRVSVDGAPFTGPGAFKFALINPADGTAVWTHDGTHLDGTEPDTALIINVQAGLFTALLGDAATMSAFPAGVFETYPDLQLRVWFDDGVQGSTLLTPDHPLGAVPYALSATLSPGTVTGDKLAPGSVDVTKLAAGNIAETGQLLSFDGTGLVWTTPGGGAGGSWLLGGNAGNPADSYLGTADDQWVNFRANGTFAFGIRPTDRNLVLPPVESAVFDLRRGENGLGIYGVSSDPFLGEVGRAFGNVDVDGPVLYGERGGALGVTYRSGGTPPFFFDAVRTEKPILVWQNESGDGATIHIGGYGANGNPKLIKFGDADYVHIGESGSDDHLEFKASRFNFIGGQINTLDVADNFVATIRAADLFLGHSSRRGTPGRALVDFGTDLHVNFASDWGNTYIGGAKTSVRTLEITGGSDLAEPFPMSDGKLEPGSVVVIDPARAGHLKLSTRAYDTRVAGVISGAGGVNPGIALHQQGVLEGGQNVALTGRVFVKVDADAGSVEPGDLLTTADLPGHAMKVRDHGRSQGAILGKAMTGLSSGTGLVLVLVTLQ